MTLNYIVELDLATTTCFLLLHITKFPLRIYVEVDLWFVTDSAQFALVYAFILNFIFLEVYFLAWSGFKVL